jgi:hypothetical protein
MKYIQFFLAFNFYIFVFQNASNNWINGSLQTSDGLLNMDTEITLNTKNCYAIYYYPDSLSREYLIAKNGEEQYEQIVLDIMERNYEILQHIDSLNIEVVVKDDSFFVFENDTLFRYNMINKYIGFILVLNNTPFEINHHNFRKQLELVKCN